jgi:valacyclovir hydrolase
VEGLDKSKFTVVAWDPPGYGNSRPPVRDFSQDFFHRDADWGVKLMQVKKNDHKI